MQINIICDVFFEFYINYKLVLMSEPQQQAPAEVG